MNQVHRLCTESCACQPPADFISEGHFDRHLRRTNLSNAARRNALVDAVRKEFGERADVCGANGGLHFPVWLKDKEGLRIDDVFHKAKALDEPGT